MARKISDDKILMERVIKMLPKSIPASAIESVECDPYNAEDGSASYWVYLVDGFIAPGTSCHTIHEDNLANLRSEVSGIEVWLDDDDLTENRGYGQSEATEAVKAVKKSIDDYLYEEFGDYVKADYYNPSEIGIAYTSTEDGKHDIQVYVDLNKLQIVTIVDHHPIRTEQYKDLWDINERGLKNLSFEDLVYLSDEELEEIERRTA